MTRADELLERQAGAIVVRNGEALVRANTAIIEAIEGVTRDENGVRTWLVPVAPDDVRAVWTARGNLWRVIRDPASRHDGYWLCAEFPAARLTWPALLAAGPLVDASSGVAHLMSER